MARDDQIPTPDELIGVGIDKLAEVRPSTLKHVNLGRGRYADLFAGWRAQAALLCRRDADLAKQGRLPFSSGGSLRFLTGSEFDTPATLAPTKAVGQTVIERAAGRVGGSIRKGSRFTRPADTTDLRLFTAAQYVAAIDVGVAQGQTRVTVPLEASNAGASANRPLTGTLATELELADDIVDRDAWTVVSYEMAGGSEAIDDEALKRYARAFDTGKHGPNVKAALAGALKAGVRYAIALDDTTVGALILYVADGSWASSERWTKLVRQSLYDNKHVGFGCRVLVRGATNLLVGANVVCKVRRPSYLAETTPLDASIQRAFRAYFDERTDWNRWRLTALRGVAARADRRLLTCSSASIVRLDGTTVAEPIDSTTTHFMLANQAVRVTYESPS